MPKAGVYYIYAQLWCDPRNQGSGNWCGFKITTSSNGEVARASAVKHQEDDHTMYAGITLALQANETVCVEITNSEYYEFTVTNAYFGAFLIA